MQTVIRATRTDVKGPSQQLQFEAVGAVLRRYDINQLNGDGSIKNSVSSSTPGEVGFTLLHERFVDYSARAQSIKKTLENMVGLSRLVKSSKTL